MEVYVLGENSDEQFVAWSSAAISGVPIDAVLSPGVANRSELGHKVKLEGQRIIKAKGAITFGIASVIFSICSAVLLDRRTTCAVSHFQPKMGCCLSLPVALGRQGILEMLPISLDREERTRLEATGKELKAEIERMESELLSGV
jgi:L-lactate dehydrogenase